MRVNLRNDTSSTFSTLLLSLLFLSLFIFSLSMSVSSLLGDEYCGKEKYIWFLLTIVLFFKIEIWFIFLECHMSRNVEFFIDWILAFISFFCDEYPKKLLL
jgi:hypothetical protein